MPKYEYTGVWAGRHGNMICCSCNMPIVTGQYRVEDKPERFVLWHRQCCETDPEWKRIDKIIADHERQKEVYKQACREFVKTWGKPSEDDFDGLD